MTSEEKTWYELGFADAAETGLHPDRLFQECWNHQLKRIELKFDEMLNVVHHFKFYRKGVQDFYLETNKWT